MRFAALLLLPTSRRALDASHRQSADILYLLIFDVLLVVKMNTIEAILSLMIFILIISTFISVPTPELDDSLYKLKLSEDIWRNLYLKGDFENFNKEKIKEDLNEINELTGLCVSINWKEESIKTCEPSQFVVVKRIAFINGSPEMISIKLGVNYE